MKALKKYMVYLDDGHDALRVAIPAESEKKAREYVAGNGEVIAVKDVTEDYPIDGSKVLEALRYARFGSDEIDFVVRTLSEAGITF